MRQRLYNPAQLTFQERKDTFIVRHRMLDDLLQILRRQKPDAPCQHIMLIGQRGMGKTTLGLRFLDAISEDARLSKKWQAVPFHEESYGIGDLADFWLTALRHLSAAVDHPQWAEKAERLANKEPDTERLAAHALAALRDFIAESGKRLVLFAENLDGIFSQFRDADDVNALRATLMERPEILLVGTANTYFDAIRNHGEPLYEFFRLVDLKGLESDETLKMLRTLAEGEGNANVLKTLENDPGRVETVRRLAGGNPRLLALTYRMLAESPVGSAREDLERLIDEQTPFFKARIEDIPPQARRVFHCLADRWTPLLAREAAQATRLTSSHVSAQLKQLVSLGYVREVWLPRARKVRYDLSERFYNIYYILRFSRNSRQRLERLIEFLRALFGPEGMVEVYRSTLETVRAGSNAADEGSLLLEVFADQIVKDVKFRGRARWIREAFEVCTLHDLDTGKMLGHARDLYNDNELSAPEYEKTLREFLDKHPESAREWIDLGVLLTKTDRDEEAVAAFQRVTDLNPSHSGGWLLLGALLARIDRLEEAEVTLRKAMEVEPDNALAWWMLGVLLENTDRLEEAEAALRKTTELKPDHADAWSVLGALLERTDRLKEAEIAYRKATEAEPDHADAWSILGVLLARTDRLKEAETAFRKATEVRPDHALSWSNLGNLLARTDRLEEAEAAFRKATEVEPDNALAWSNLGALLARTDRLKEAEVAYRKATEVEVDHAHVWWNLGVFLLNTDRLEEAEATFHKATEVEPDNAHAWHFLGLHLDHTGRPEEAEAAFRKATEVEPDNAHAWHFLGLHLDHTDRPEEAVAAFRKSVEIKQDYGAAWNSLAWNLLRQNDARRMDEAEECARRAVTLETNSPDAHHTLADILGRQNKWAEAMDALTQAIVMGGAEWREKVSGYLTRTLIAATAAGQERSVKEIMENNNLVDLMEPLWHAVRLELDEELEPLPAEIMDAVKEVQGRIAEQRGTP
ncbi:MAG: tetratricopeptide repeat protein [Proteobacteria bacterium]|nr:tetratricopeptide repeat protein [Pseudomonadota bacterium]